MTLFWSCIIVKHTWRHACTQMTLILPFLCAVFLLLAHHICHRSCCWNLGILQPKQGRVQVGRIMWFLFKSFDELPSSLQWKTRRYVCPSDIQFINSSSLFVLQVVNDITTFYMQTYNNFKSTGDERLRETLRVIQHGVSQLQLCSIADCLDFSQILSNRNFTQTFQWDGYLLLSKHTVKLFFSVTCQ